MSWWIVQNAAIGGLLIVTVHLVSRALGPLARPFVSSIRSFRNISAEWRLERWLPSTW